jgi:hypothetical protein
MLPPDALRCVVTLTSEKLEVIEKLVVTVGEIPKDFGISTAVAPCSTSSHNNALCPPGIGDEDWNATCCTVLAPVVSLQGTPTSVASRAHLHNVGQKQVGVLKTATRRFQTAFEETL